MDLDTLKLAKNYTEQSISGTGSIAGAPCTIKDITKEGNINTVTFEWQLKDGTTKTAAMQVEDGEKGDPGEKGSPGEAGFSPTAAMVRNEEQGIVTIVITDETGKHTAILKDGAAGSFSNEDVLKKLSANANDDLVYNGRVVKGQEFSNKDVLDKFASDASGNIYYDKKILTFDNEDILKKLSVINDQLAYNGTVVDFVFMNQAVLLKLSESLDGYLVYGSERLLNASEIKDIELLNKLSADNDNNLYYNTIKVSGEKFANKTILDELGENIDGGLTYKNADVSQKFSNAEVLEELSEDSSGELLYKNSQVGHTFENQEVLEKLEEDPSTGNLIYNSKVIKADLDATNAEEGQTPVADGAGAWSWQNQKVTVDNELSETSQNPVENAVITNKINSLDTQMKEVFQSVSDGKSLVASAITDKGIPTDKDATFAAMSKNIAKIDGYATTDILSQTVMKALVVDKGIVTVNSYDQYYCPAQEDIFRPGDKPWEVGVKIIFKQKSSYSQVFFGSNKGGSFFNIPSVEIQGNGYLRCCISTTGTSWDLETISEKTLELNTWYYIKYTFDGNRYVVSVSTNEETWEEFNVIESNKLQAFSNNIEFGGIALSSNHVARYVNFDLDWNYIKIDGVYVYGGTNNIISILDEEEF